jgi:hypothetical protein
MYVNKRPGLPGSFILFKMSTVKNYKKKLTFPSQISHGLRLRLAGKELKWADVTNCNPVD